MSERSASDPGCTHFIIPGKRAQSRQKRRGPLSLENDPRFNQTCWFSSHSPPPPLPPRKTSGRTGLVAEHCLYVNRSDKMGRKLLERSRDNRENKTSPRDHCIHLFVFDLFHVVSRVCSIIKFVTSHHPYFELFSDLKHILYQRTRAYFLTKPV